LENTISSGCVRQADRHELSNYQFVVSFEDGVSEALTDSTDPFSLLDRPDTGFEPAFKTPDRRPAPPPISDAFDFAMPNFADDDFGPGPASESPRTSTGKAATESNHVPDTNAFITLPDVAPSLADEPDTLVTIEQGSRPPINPAALAEPAEDDPFAFLNDFDHAPATAPIPAPIRSPEPKPVPKPQAQPAVAAPAPAPDLALSAFLKGAGLDPATIKETDSLAILTRAGEILHESVDGLIEILKARDMIRSDLRMERTMQIDNRNPLRFSYNSKKSLATLLGRPRPGYQEGAAAAKTAVKDILAHEMALVKAMEIALNNLLERFRPENLTKRIEPDNLLDSMIPQIRRARYWELFEKDYRKIAADMTDNFHIVFGDALTNAYQNQLNKLDEEDEDASVSTR
ncbi:MAG: type VI secretion system-associated FHA domain protein TagH, partial [Rhodospirillaceae bacterium]